MPGRLDGEVAVVAGVGRGMGAAVAVRFAEEGARLMLAARSPDRLEEVAGWCRSAGADVTIQPTDLADREAVVRLRDETERRLGPPTILANIVGAWSPAPADRHDPLVIDAMLEGNLRAIMTTTPLFAARMVEAQGGAILNVSSAYGGAFPSKGQAVYNATKAGVRAYTESAAADLAAKRVRVNCVLPGGTSHDYVPGREVDALRGLGTSATGAPEDVAAAALFLVSKEASWVTGASLLVDGGARFL